MHHENKSETKGMNTKPPIKPSTNWQKKKTMQDQVQITVFMVIYICLLTP